MVAPTLLRPVHDFLAGSSDRLLAHLDPIVARRDEYMRPALRRDVAAAAGFFRYGPRAIRDLCRRHDVRPPVSRASFVELIRAEVEAELGAFELAPRVTSGRRRTT